MSITISANKLYLISSLSNDSDEVDCVNFKARKDISEYKICTPYDWSADPFNDRNWCAQLHMWRHIDYKFVRYEKHRDISDIKAIVNVAVDWHRFHVVENRKSTYAWQDMIVGVRAMKIAFIVFHIKKLPELITVDQLNAINDLLRLHIKWLLNEKYVKYSNHTFSDLHGLMALSQVIDLNESNHIKSIVSSRLERLVKHQFTSDGVHKENSIGYHYYSICCLKRLINTGWFVDSSVLGIVNKAVDILQQLYMPDGTLPPIGDTDGSVQNKSYSRSECVKSEILEYSGYVIVKNYDYLSTKDLYLFFMGAYNSKYHKQSDDLSLLWFFGERILSDPGKYAYKTDDYRNYFISRRAHNTVQIHGMPLPELAMIPYGSAIKGIQSYKWGHVIKSSVQYDSVDVNHIRYCACTFCGSLLVIDILDSINEQKFTQWWHLDSNISISSKSTNGFHALLPSGRTLSASFISTNLASIDYHRGESEPEIQGWLSDGYRKLLPSYAIGVTATGNSQVYAALFSVHGNVGLSIDDKMNIYACIKTDEVANIDIVFRATQQDLIVS